MSDDTLTVPADPDNLRRESAGELRISEPQIADLKINWSTSCHPVIEPCKFCGESLGFWHAVFVVPSKEGDFRVCILAVIRRLATMPDWQDLIEFTPKEKP